MPQVPTSILTSTYDYPLPEAKIAKFPLAKRADAKLLHYNTNSRNIQDTTFRELPNLLPTDGLLLFNDTKVVPARLFFEKSPGGAIIEIFCLTPVSGAPLYEALGQKQQVAMRCMIRNKKKWKSGQNLTKCFHYEGIDIELQATPDFEQSNEQTDEDGFAVNLSWTPAHLTFANILEAFGQIPLPPYLKRAVEPMDKERYQTVFAQNAGAVAAPTAGLHYTPEVLSAIEQRGITQGRVSLHVGAGTFKPLSAENALEHPMHSEVFRFEKATIEQIRQNLGQIYCVGTTSLRALESLYWLAAQLYVNPQDQLLVSKTVAYQDWELPDTKTLINYLLDWMEARKMTHLEAATAIMIVPGYTFKLCNGLQTNFHQPKSTLMLLVAAFVGADWKKIYQHALDHNYRFLSYGDACFLEKKKP